MAAEGQKLYYNALIAGGLGFITFGWDAGVLGGILLTPEFQAAMGVRLLKSILIEWSTNCGSIQTPTQYP
jgi:hypothetical protein